MAPEQADPARGPITPRTDVYALGGLLYALLTGKPPIQGDSLTAVLTRVVSPEPVHSPRKLRGDVPWSLTNLLEVPEQGGWSPLCHGLRRGTGVATRTPPLRTSSTAKTCPERGWRLMCATSRAATGFGTGP